MSDKCTRGSAQNSKNSTVLHMFIINSTEIIKVHLSLALICKNNPHYPQHATNKAIAI